MRFEQLSRGRISLSSSQGYGIFFFSVSKKKKKVEEVALWGLPGHMSGLDLSAGANDPESGRPAPWEMKAL